MPPEQATLDLDADLRADVAAALNAGAETAPPPVEPAVEQPVDEAPVVEDAGGKGGRPRDESGRFKSRDAGEKAPVTEAKPPGTDQTEQPAEATAQADRPAEGKDDQPGELQPPRSWSVKAKSEFMNLPRTVQEQVLRSEEDVQKGKQEWSTKAEDYNRLNKVIEPMREAWAMQGMAPDVAVGQLVAAANMLQKNPREGFERLLQIYAGDQSLHLINEIAMKHGYALYEASNEGQQPHQGGARTGAPAQADPTVGRLETQIHELTQRLQTYEQKGKQSQQEQLVADVNAVRNDPNNVYFDNVQNSVAVLAQSKLDSGDKRPVKEIVQEAYEEAVWANRETRELVQADAAKKAKAEQDRKDREKAEAAKKAGASITGSPGMGAPSGQPNGSTLSNLNDDIAADVRAAMNASRA